jgi:hypothetical protein
MDLDSLFADRTAFETVDGIKKFVVKSKYFNSDEESPERSNALLIFSTPYQHTWLVVTEKRLYCILDDLRKQEPHINWSMKSDDIIRDGKIVLPINVRNKSKDTGLVDFGRKHEDWLFSRKLFLSQPVDTMIKKILQRSMILKEFR